MPSRPALRRQIAADLIEKINDGTYAPGDRLPTDQQLADQYGCSLTPVKYAMDELSLRGYVVRHQGSATTVAVKPPAAEG